MAAMRAIRHDDPGPVRRSVDLSELRGSCFVAISRPRAAIADRMTHIVPLNRTESSRAGACGGRGGTHGHPTVRTPTQHTQQTALAADLSDVPLMCLQPFNVSPNEPFMFIHL